MNPDDLQIELAYPRRPGGQSVGMPRPDIKVTHLPSGNIVIVGSERSQKQNRDLAISMMEWMLTEMRP
jgi:peptide chain release factor 2